MKMNGKLSRNTVAAILAFTLLITAFNITQNPVVEAEEPTTTRYGGAGVSFEAPVGMRFNFSRLGEESLSYMEGYLYRLRYDNETHLPFISITWQEWGPMDFTEAIARGYNYSDSDDVGYSLDGFVNSTISEHVFLYQRFNKTSPTGNRTGYIGYWNCTNSGRVHTLLAENKIDTDLSSLFELFNLTRATLVCHYPGQTPPVEVEKIKLPFDVNTLIDVSLMIMMTVGFTFTYMMEGFPNFAHTSYAGVGALVTFYLTQFAGFNPYDTWPFAAFFGGLIGLALYLGVVKPIRRNGGYQDITLTFTFLVLATVIPMLLYIFNYWSRYIGGSAARGYNLHFYDFSYLGIPGIAMTSTATCILLIIWLRRFLSQNKIGLSLRAVAENEDLAATIGINTHRAHCASWFISGALSALVGSIMTIHKGVGIAGPDGLIISIMSGAILGGVHSIYGAIIGGLFVSLAQDLLRKFFFMIFGLGIEAWARLLPMLFLVVALTVFPNGLISPEGISVERIRIALDRLEQRLKRLLK
jgi:branched-chain amino acid transport system permease protein